jgi:hypothetical protein
VTASPKTANFPWEEFNMNGPEISEAFRAGWDATTDHLDGVANYAEEDYERHLRDAWDKYCGTRTPAPARFTTEEFVDDWNRVVAFVSEMAEKYNMRRPDMVFHPEWLAHMRAVSHQHIADTLIHMGVRVRFATWQQVDALR